MLASEDRQAYVVGLAMVGDIMWIRSGWSGFLTTEVLDYMNAYDVVLGNLETVISGSFRVPRVLPDYVRFNSHPALVTSFRRPDGRNTFTALSIANNHMLDYSDLGALDVMRFLDREQILHSGIRKQGNDRRYVTFTVDGIKIGFYAATWGINSPKKEKQSTLKTNTIRGLAPEDESDADLSEVKATLQAMADEQVDFKIVGLHWGFEYELHPSPKQMQVGREIVRAGADLIMGSHPHVPQPSEICFINGYENRYGDLKDRFPAMNHPTGCILNDHTGRPRKAIICYSLGNFATAMYTFLCRVGLIQGLRLRREPATGRVDWFFPHGKLVYNVRKDAASGERRVALLEAFVRGNHGKRPISKKLQEDLSFLTNHVVADL